MSLPAQNKRVRFMELSSFMFECHVWFAAEKAKCIFLSVYYRVLLFYSAVIQQQTRAAQRELPERWNWFPVVVQHSDWLCCECGGCISHTHVHRAFIYIPSSSVVAELDLHPRVSQQRIGWPHSHSDGDLSHPLWSLKITSSIKR